MEITIHNLYRETGRPGKSKFTPVYRCNLSHFKAQALSPPPTPGREYRMFLPLVILHERTASLLPVPKGLLFVFLHLVFGEKTITVLWAFSYLRDTKRLLFYYTFLLSLLLFSVLPQGTHWSSPTRWVKRYALSVWGTLPKVRGFSP